MVAFSPLMKIEGLGFLTNQVPILANFLFKDFIVAPVISLVNPRSMESKISQEGKGFFADHSKRWSQER